MGIQQILDFVWLSFHILMTFQFVFFLYNILFILRHSSSQSSKGVIWQRITRSFEKANNVVGEWLELPKDIITIPITADNQCIRIYQECVLTTFDI